MEEEKRKRPELKPPGLAEPCVRRTPAELSLCSIRWGWEVFKRPLGYGKYERRVDALSALRMKPVCGTACRVSLSPHGGRRYQFTEACLNGTLGD